MRKRLPTIILIVLFLIGLSLLLYPTLSDYWNSFHQTKAISSYSEIVADLDDETYERLWKEAQQYNKTLVGRGASYTLSKAEQKKYESLLNVTENGMMGYIEIPAIDCSLPIYHGTNDAILQTSIGHIAGSSLPVGGKSTHCVLSGHRGLPSARLFTDLDKLTEGDLFMLHVLDRTLTYEVDQILIVEPDELDALRIEEGKDYCTLVTCTPYGINTHRLLVRGHRVKNQSTDQNVRTDAIQIEPIIVAALIAVPLLLLLLIGLLVTTHKKRRK